MGTIGRPKSLRSWQRASIGGIGLALIVFSIGIAAEAQSPQSRWKPGQSYVLRVGASNPSHTTYAIVAAQKAIIEKSLPGVRIVMEATKGGPDGLRESEERLEHPSLSKEDKRSCPLDTTERSCALI
jgi:hypothetical protein